MSIRVLISGKQGLLFNSHDVEILRREGRIVGTMIGQLRGKKMPCEEGTLPLLLNPQEVTLAIHLGLVTCYSPGYTSGDHIEEDLLFSGKSITIPNSPTDSHFVKSTWTYPETPEEHFSFAVFKDLHFKNFYLTDGIKFGGDWLAYPGDPLLYHAQFVVRLHRSEELINPLLLVASAREVHAARKHLLLAFTSQDMTYCHYSNVKLEYMTVAPYGGFRKNNDNKKSKILST